MGHMSRSGSRRRERGRKWSGTELGGAVDGGEPVSVGFPDPNPPEEPQLGADPTLMCRLYRNANRNLSMAITKTAQANSRRPSTEPCTAFGLALGIYIVIRYKCLHRMPGRFLVGLAIELGRWRMSLV